MSLSALLPMSSLLQSAGSLTSISSTPAVLPLLNPQSPSSLPAQSASAATSALSQFATDTYTPSGGAGGTIAGDFTTAVQDGVQLVQWMESQAALAGSAQSDPSAVDSSTGSGEALAAQFASDLSTLGSDISQSAAGSAQSGATASIESALTQAIAASTNNNSGSGNYNLSISAASLNQLASAGAGENAAASATALKIQLTNATPSDASATGASRFLMALEYSTADVAASTGSADGDAINAETSSFSTLSEMKRSSGVSVLAAELSSANVAGAAGSANGGSAANPSTELAASSSSFSMESLQASGRGAARESAAMLRQWENAPYGADSTAAPPQRDWE